MTTEVADSIYVCTPREVKEFAIDVIQAGRVPFIQSSPGMGKSSIMREVAAEFGLWLIDHRLSTSAPEDLSGLPEFYNDAAGVRRARFVPFEMFPVEGTPIPAGYEGWMLFLDEANSGTKMVQAASYKLVLDKMVGQLKLHERVAMSMAGNMSTDRAITTALSTAMQSRVVHLHMVINHREWLEDVALKQGYDERIIAFLNWKDEYLMDFRPDHQEKTFCCPRTWEFMNDLVKGKAIEDRKTKLYGGTITSGVAAEFVQFAAVYKELAKLDDVLRDPAGMPVPQGANRRWAIVSHLMGKTDETNFTKVAEYINRFDLGFRALYFRGVLAQKPVLRTHPAFGPAMVEVNKYLNGPSTTP